MCMSDTTDSNENEEENYAYDEPTPADEVVSTDDGAVILRMGEPPIEVGGGSKAEQFPNKVSS